MDRRAFLWTLVGGGVASPLTGEAQQPRKIARIGFLNVSNTTVAAPSLEALRQGLRELGWTEGHSARIWSTLCVLSSSVITTLASAAFRR